MAIQNIKCGECPLTWEVTNNPETHRIAAIGLLMHEHAPNYSVEELKRLAARVNDFYLTAMVQMLGDEDNDKVFNLTLQYVSSKKWTV